MKSLQWKKYSLLVIVLNNKTISCDMNCIKMFVFAQYLQERREREQQELESAKEIADDDFDDFP